MNEHFPESGRCIDGSGGRKSFVFCKVLHGLEKNFETAYDIGEEFNDAKIFLAIKNAADKAAAEKI